MTELAVAAVVEHIVVVHRTSELSGGRGVRGKGFALRLLKAARGLRVEEGAYRHDAEIEQVGLDTDRSEQKEAPRPNYIGAAGLLRGKKELEGDD